MYKRQYFGLENLSDPENSTIAHHINQAIKAHGTMKRDIDYVIKDCLLYTSPIFFPWKENGRCDRPKERRLHCKRAARRAAMLADCTAHSLSLINI